MLESQFYSLGQVCLAGKRLCFDRLQCVDAWMMNVGLVEFSETLFMTYVNKQNLFSGSSSLSSWKIEFRKSLITLHNSVNIGIQHQFHLKWSMLQTFWKLGQSSMHLKSPVSLTGFEDRIQARGMLKPTLSLFFTSSIVQVLPLWLSKTANLFFWSCHLRTVLALAWIRSLGCFKLKFNAIVSSVHILMSITIYPWLWVIP